MNSTRQSKGFSLIELLAVLAIIGVLMTIALPSYRRHVLKAHRSEAIQALQAMQLAQERHRSQQPTYAVDLASLNVGARTQQGRYLLRVLSASNTSYVMDATAHGDQAADQECHRFQLRMTGMQTAHAAFDHLGADRLATCWPR